MVRVGDVKLGLAPSRAALSGARGHRKLPCRLLRAHMQLGAPSRG